MFCCSSLFCGWLWFAIFAYNVIGLHCKNAPCALRKYSSDSSVCVCNSTYCDTFTVELPPDGKIAVYTTSKNGLPFQSHTIDVSKLVTKPPSRAANISSAKYQTVKGFGGALTDAASINIMNLSKNARDNLLKSYFGATGIEYNIIRIPMGSCDYSTRYYTYLDTPENYNLSTFSLAPEDTKLRIPLLKQVMNISRKAVSLYASPWTVPIWMKSNHKVTGLGTLIGSPGDKYHKTWAKYFSKFFDAYKSEGINFWGVTMQNEPSNGLIVPADWQSTGWLPEHQREFIKTDLGPELVQSGYGNVKLMIHDDQRILLPEWPRRVLSDRNASKYISGIAIHWYFDWLVGPEVLNHTHHLFPDKFLLATEACNEDTPRTSLGSWASGEKYSNDILDNLCNYAIGWVDWNMCLNMDGGPNWVHNFDNSPIIVNASSDEFYKQPMYYHLGHFSKFIPEGSVRLQSSTDATFEVKHVVVQRRDGYFAAVVLNRNDKAVSFTLSIKGQSLSVTIPKRSIQTYLWK